ncbi:MAG TPA: hypothetical protein VIV58_05275 [Kofleriaceae bacterium]
MTDDPRLRVSMSFPPGRSALQYERVLARLVAWRPDLAPRTLERPSDPDAPDEPWRDARWPEVAALCAGDRLRTWNLLADRGAISCSRKPTSVEIKLVIPRPSAEPAAELARLLSMFELGDVPALVLGFDPASLDGRLLFQGLHGLEDVPPLMFVDRTIAAMLGGERRLAGGPAELRPVAGGLLISTRPVYGGGSSDASARTRAMAKLLGLPRALDRSVLPPAKEPELVELWPTGADEWFHGIWSNADDTGWAVGDRGQIARWDGRDWELVDSTFEVFCTSVSGFGDDRVWAAGEHGQVVGWDGGRWALSNVGCKELLHGIHAVARDRVVVVGERGTICRGDGATWTPMESGTELGLYGVSGAGNELWAVGEAGLMLTYDGRRWSRVSAPVATNLNAVSVVAPGEAWAVGQEGRVLYVRDGLVSSIESGVDVHLHGVVANASDDVWVVGDECTIRHWNGKRWRSIATDTNQTLLAVCNASARDIWTVGRFNSILRVRSD